MKSLNECMIEYKKQIHQGDIKRAYQGLIEYMMKLRIHFKSKYSDYNVSGSIYYGYMDMTYFSVTPEVIKNNKLKIALVFLHDEFRFEVWLSGNNKQIQRKYWKLFKDEECDKYKIPSNIESLDSIIEYILVENPDFSDLDALTEQIENKVLRFIEDIETFILD